MQQLRKRRMLLLFLCRCQCSYGNNCYQESLEQINTYQKYLGPQTSKAIKHVLSSEHCLFCKSLMCIMLNRALITPQNHTKAGLEGTSRDGLEQSQLMFLQPSSNGRVCTASSWKLVPALSYPSNEGDFSKLLVKSLCKRNQFFCQYREQKQLFLLLLTPFFLYARRLTASLLSCFPIAPVSLPITPFSHHVIPIALF